MNDDGCRLTRLVDDLAGVVVSYLMSVPRTRSISEDGCATRAGMGMTDHAYGWRARLPGAAAKSFTWSPVAAGASNRAPTKGIPLGPGSPNHCRSSFRQQSQRQDATPPPSSDRCLTANSDSQDDSQRDGHAWIDVDNHAARGAPLNSEWTSIAGAGPWSVDLQNRLWGGAEPSQVGSIPIHPRHVMRHDNLRSAANRTRGHGQTR